MKIKQVVLVILAVGTLTMFSCSVEDLFEQPTIEVIGYTLKDLPGEYTYLDIEVKLTNNDSREAYITDVEYQVEIEGYLSEAEQFDVNQDILTDTPLELSLPLTLVTNDAIQLLTQMDAGKELSYKVTGTFHVDDPVLNLFDLPINIEGTTLVESGFEDLFEQPEVIVKSMTTDYAINGFTSYTFDFEVNCSAENMDSHDAMIDEIVYVVFVEGVESESHTQTYLNYLSIESGEIIDLTLPVTLNVGIAEGASLISDLADANADYIVEGTFHVVKVDGSPADFLLPLYLEGSVPVTMVTK